MPCSYENPFLLVSTSSGSILLLVSCWGETMLASKLDLLKLAVPGLVTLLHEASYKLPMLLRSSGTPVVFLKLKLSSEDF